MKAWKIWTEEDRQTLRQLYPNTKTSEVAAKLGRSIKSVHEQAKQYGIEKLPEFKRVSIPKGTKPACTKPVGSITLGSDGYQVIKVDGEKRAWALLHREVWRQAHGSYPKRGEALVFKDGNKLNCSPDNLELISRKELMSRNSYHNYPPEIAKTIQLIGVLNRRINNHGKQHN